MRDKISRYRSEEETDKLLEEQFIREAEEMEARILRAAGADPMEEPPEESQEEISAGYDRVIATLKASGEYREETEDRKLLGFQELLFGRKLPGALMIGALVAGQIGLFIYDRAYEYVQGHIWNKMRGKLFRY